MPIIIKRPLAERDLDGIFDYIADDNAGKAEELIRLLNQKFIFLADNPRIGRLRDDLAPLLRSFPVGRHIIFYRSIQDGIEIVRVLHGAQDIPTQDFGTAIQ